jgi:hypothetical protein
MSAGGSKGYSKRPHKFCNEFPIQNGRKRIETTFSDIEKDFLENIHAVTQNWFLIKLIVSVFSNTLKNSII